METTVPSTVCTTTYCTRRHSQTDLLQMLCLPPAMQSMHYLHLPPPPQHTKSGPVTSCTPINTLLRYTRRPAQHKLNTRARVQSPFASTTPKSGIPVRQLTIMFNSLSSDGAYNHDGYRTRVGKTAHAGGAPPCCMHLAITHQRWNSPKGTKQTLQLAVDSLSLVWHGMGSGDRIAQGSHPKNSPQKKKNHRFPPKHTLLLFVASDEPKRTDIVKSTDTVNTICSYHPHPTPPPTVRTLIRCML